MRSVLPETKVDVIVGAFDLMNRLNMFFQCFPTVAHVFGCRGCTHPVSFVLS